MHIRKSGMKELRRARRLQAKLADLHIPVPVMSWGYELKDKDGETTEKGIGKSNSYNRNALNLIAINVGCVSQDVVKNTNEYFIDSYIALRNTSGTAVALNGYYTGRYSPSTKNVDLVVGAGTDTESLDTYDLTSSGISSLTQYTQSVFSTETRIFTTVISRSFINNTESTINITEAGIKQYLGSTSSYYYVLILRDVFSPIAVAPGETLTWTYTFEVAYPNPQKKG